MGGDASGEFEGCWVGEEWGGGVGWEVGVEGGEAGVEWGGEGIGGEVGDGDVWDGGVVEEVLGNKKPRPGERGAVSLGHDGCRENELGVKVRGI